MVDRCREIDSLLKKIEWAMLDFTARLALRPDTKLRLRTSERESDHQLTYTKRTLNKLSYNMRTLAQVYQLLLCNKRSTIRDLYYDHKQLYRKQEILNRSITDVCELLDADRQQLNLLSTSKGLVFGPLSLRFDSEDKENSLILECTRKPLLITEEFVGARFTSSAEFIVIVEKDATFQKLLDDGFSYLYPKSILITGKGYPDLVSRQFVSRLVSSLNIAVFGLFDADPHGIEIFLTYKYGSSKTRVEGRGASVACIQWLGLRPSEGKTLPIAADQLLSLQHSDYRKAAKVRRRAEMLVEKDIVYEMDVLRSSGCKMELEAVSSAGPAFLPRLYLAPRLRQLLDT